MVNIDLLLLQQLWHHGLFMRSGVWHSFTLPQAHALSLSLGTTYRPNENNKSGLSGSSNWWQRSPVGPHVEPELFPPFLFATAADAHTGDRTDVGLPIPRPGVSCLSSSPPIVRPQPALQAGGRRPCPLWYG
jgi:hypothetical protein